MRKTRPEGAYQDGSARRFGDAGLFTDGDERALGECFLAVKWYYGALAGFGIEVSPVRSYAMTPNESVTLQIFRYLLGCHWFHTTTFRFRVMRRRSFRR